MKPIDLRDKHREMLIKGAFSAAHKYLLADNRCEKRTFGPHHFLHLKPDPILSRQARDNHSES
jgi:hypothetical protein